jgi:endonuclease/exonuclease/phosphatase family metal-dependent hydrolase
MVTAAKERASVVLVALTTVIAVECARVLFSVAYHAGESLGNLTSGLLVLVVLATPALAGPLRRLVPAPVLLGASVGVMVISRVALQAVGDVGFPLAGVATASSLFVLALAVVACRRHDVAGSTGVAVGVAVGLFLDVLLRATGTTWDIVWRSDPSAWVLSGALLVGVAVSAVGALRFGAVPDADDTHAGLSTFLLWPYVYFAIVYTQNPAFLDSSGGSSLAVGLAVALLAAATGVVALVVAARWGPPRSVLLGVAALLAVTGFALPVLTGAVVLVAAVVAQIAAAVLLGAASGAAPGADRQGIAPSALAFAGGVVWMGSAILAAAINVLQPLPFPSRFIPAAVGLSMGVAMLAPQTRDDRLRARPARPALALAAAMGVVVVLVPLVVAARWPATEIPDVASRPLRVMTFNIEQGLTLGQLRLEQMAEHIESADPDVVVLEEVGRGWALSGMVDGAAWFGRRLRMSSVWAPAADNQFGNVVLSRLPITASEIMPLGKGNGTQDRSAAFVHVDAAGKDLLVIGTHLMNGSSPPMHESRAEAYTAILERWAGSPRTVLLGDLNTYPRLVPPGWPELNLPLDAGFTTTQDVDRCTMPTSNENCPDWIFVSPDLSQSTVEIVVDRPDHRPIVAEVG